MVPHPELAVNLAHAVVTSSNAPILLLDGDMSVVAASNSFCRAFEIEPKTIVGLQIYALGNGEWDAPRLRSLLDLTVSGVVEIEVYEMDLMREGQPTRRLVLHAHRLDYSDAPDVRLILAVSDVTDARHAERLKDDLLREKAMLLQEIQHRVANSLQIIASVLMQSARRVHSAETRTHLFAAHERIMSVAAVQKQLAVSTLGDVILRPYFNQLCQSLGASMIRDHKHMSIEVHADESEAEPEASVSLGLIITELVINALKHAFPGRRNGKILVHYASDGPSWTLSVSDDGVGMAAGKQKAKAGLGTNIIKALAQQLHARIEVVDKDPGTSVSIIHTHGDTVEPGAAV